MKTTKNWGGLRTSPVMRRIVFAVLCGFVMSMSVRHLIADGPIVPDVGQWRLSGTGELVEPGILQVTGNGGNVSAWQSPSVALQPGAFYRFSVSHRGVDSSGGCLPCGVEGFTRDYSTQPNRWTDESFYFKVPPGVSSAPLKVGQWESNGTFQFRDVKLEQVVPVCREFDLPFGKLLLGEGEIISDGKYQFRGNLGSKGTNIHRPFHGALQTVFNTDRWCLGNGSDVCYQFDLQSITGDATAIPFEDGKITVNVNHHTGGEGLIAYRTSDMTHLDWVELGKLDKVETKEFVLPKEVFPTKEVTLLIRGLDGANFQVNRIDFEASLPETFAETDLHSLNLMGDVLFATIDLLGADPPIRNLLTLAESYGRFRPLGGPTPPTNMLTLTQNNEIRTFKLISGFMGNIKLIPLEKSRSPGEIEQTFEFDGVKYSLTTQTHPLERSDYGYILPGQDGTCWWCEADWKISRDRQPPEVTPETTRPITISAAKNDVEGFQFVVRADRDTPITGLTGSVTGLQGPNGAVIPAENVELLYAYYHFVHSKTDGTGLVGDWPDALPPLDHPVDIAAGKNQPVWINVKVPADAVAGDYQGTFRLTSGDGQFDMTVPYALHVWNFALPTENHLESAYGYNPNQAARYHNARTDADRRRVNEMYLQCFSDHRISIYTPAPFDGISVQWLPNENPPRCEIDFSRFDAEMDRVLKKFHFTNFTVPGNGLGGGTFHARTEPSIADFAEDTPEYKAMIADYYGKLQAHLIEKGWIDKAYIYWFDEPGEHDYEFVANGTAKIQQYGPKIQRFMTLMMDNDGFMKALDAQNTTINIWCSISNSFRDELAKQRRALGERFWWYICTGPKAPYCTLFIDHPATELRVWHWQAWQRNVVGSLVWESTYWHSGTAFPDSFQNPYDDPMGYVSGYSTPSGTKLHWGNGDGRFISPPLAAAVP
ncbi:MAG: hypothetical protein FWH27_16970, partial [Planctomycetaceae bacterium]|nr:hypothetical protein [Planctomycetaceae bacterium]